MGQEDTPSSCSAPNCQQNLGPETPSGPFQAELTYDISSYHSSSGIIKRFNLDQQFRSFGVLGPQQG